MKILKLICALCNSEQFSPLATAIIGGVLASTLFTLVVIPVLMKLAIRHAGTS